MCSMNCGNQSRKRRAVEDDGLSVGNSGRLAEENGVNKYTLSSKQLVLIDGDETNGKKRDADLERAIY